MKDDFFVKGNFDSLVGPEQTKYSSGFWFIFRNVKESKAGNVGAYLRGYSEETIAKALASRYGEDAELKGVDIFTCLEIAKIPEEKVKYYHRISGIGKRIPRALKDYIKKNWN